MVQVVSEKHNIYFEHTLHIQYNYYNKPFDWLSGRLKPRSPGFDSWVLCVDFACFLCVSVGFLFPFRLRTFQNHAGKAY